MTVLELVISKKVLRKSGNTMKKISLSVLAVVLLIVALQAQAGTGINSAGLLDDILERFANTASGWGDRIVSYGLWLFWGLTLLSMVWTYGMMVLKKSDIQEFFAETIRFLAATGFFLWILVNGPAIAISIINTCRQIAANASGLSNALSPSGIVDIGFDIAGKVVDKSSIWSPADSTVGLLVATVILCMLALVAINMLLMLITGWLLAYAGVFILGFGGGHWTQDIAIAYYKQVLGVGIQTFVMILLVGIGQSFIDQYYAAMGDDMALKELLVMLVASFVLLMLVAQLPPMFAGIVGAGSGGGSLAFGMGAALGAAGMAAATAGAAGAAAISGATSAAGGMSALQAAFESAQQSMDAGSSPSGEGRSSSGGSLSEAMGRAGGFARSMGSSLVDAARDVAQEKAGAIKDSIQERVSETTGGKMADSIRESSGMNIGNDNSQFDGDGLGAGNNAGNSASTPETDEEMIDQFVNKK
ncbi:conjugal transfer protein TrbL/VirB6 (plasmid) [Yersinia pseudotuberculosis IP 31758]|uniref:Conjugal transfer protein TrbL/VirB6 n=2 Tax=Yersinia pseudotuberculosis TaxID=633 RepID=A0A0U1QT94_YERP3|nr:MULTISPECIES: P-type conjugative transfer protein TrbL [Yersinia pseudotuberculosis complex]ABS45603.1 conjugal transfer protein TrbL/VirB6 [Yersinia pseudotuberculosis IP 31758]